MSHEYDPTLHAASTFELNHSQVKAMYASIVALRVLRTVTREHSDDEIAHMGSLSHTFPETEGDAQIDVTGFWGSEAEDPAGPIAEFEYELPVAYHDFLVGVGGIVTLSKERNQMPAAEYTFWEIMDEQSDLNGGVIIIGEAIDSSGKVIDEPENQAAIVLDEAGVDGVVQLLVDTAQHTTADTLAETD